MRPDRAPTDTSEALSCLTCSDEAFLFTNLVRQTSSERVSAVHLRQNTLEKRAAGFADWNQQDIEMAPAVRTKLAESWPSNQTK